VTENIYVGIEINILNIRKILKNFRKGGSDTLNPLRYGHVGGCRQNVFASENC
jgi:hypothetical protein